MQLSLNSRQACSCCVEGMKKNSNVESMLTTTPPPHEKYIEGVISALEISLAISRDTHGYGMVGEGRLGLEWRTNSLIRRNELS